MTGNSSLICADCVFKNNIARMQGRGGAISFASEEMRPDAIQLFNCIFQNNSANYGGEQISLFASNTVSLLCRCIARCESTVCSELYGAIKVQICDPH